jgi:hypothetical protein
MSHDKEHISPVLTQITMWVDEEFQSARLENGLAGPLDPGTKLGLMSRRRISIALARIHEVVSVCMRPGRGEPQPGRVQTMPCGPVPSAPWPM